MSAKVIIFLFYIHFILFTNCQDALKFFRKDYDYIKDTQAFYKFHTIFRNWKDAKETCESEGASFFYPYDLDEFEAVRDYWNRTQTFNWIFVGISTPNAPSVFETVDGLSMSQVYNTWNKGEPNTNHNADGCVTMKLIGGYSNDQCSKNLNFICKKALNTLEWNMACDIPDKAYEYTQSGRCYKFHLKPREWQDAIRICDGEQSYLAIVNSDAEAELLVNIIKNAPMDQVEDIDYLSGAIHLGFKFDNIWKTIKGEPLKISGYSKWGGGQPDGKGEEKCGSMFYNGRLNDISCNQKCLFICEHEPSILGAAYDFRFG